jgi:predicted DNA-binding antitoxin AbrB/MazE fold protein
MHMQIKVVYENGVLRPLDPLPARVQEHQHLIVTIETTNVTDHWLADADSAISLEAVRQGLAKMPSTLAQQIYAEREER